MDINQLRYFKAVANTGKIAAAAQEMYVTSPAISASIAALEQELDVKLFHRTANSLVLARQGEIFLEYVDHILLCLDDAKTELKESLSDGKKQVTVGSTSANLFADLLCDFSIRYPEITLTSSTVQPKYINNAGINSRFSFLFATEHDAPASYTDGCESLCLFRDAPALMLHPNHPWGKKESLSLEELSGQSVIWPRINHGLSELLLKEFAIRSLPPTLFTYHNFQTALALVGKNAGAALVTAHSKTQMTRNFVFVPIAPDGCNWRQMLYWRTEHPFTHEDHLFLEFVKTYYGV